MEARNIKNCLLKIKINFISSKIYLPRMQQKGIQENNISKEKFKGNSESIKIKK